MGAKRAKKHPEARYGAILERATARSANENAEAVGWRAPTPWLVTIVRLDGSRVRHDVASYAEGVVLRTQILADDPSASCGWVIQLPVPTAHADSAKRYAREGQRAVDDQRAHVLDAAEATA